MTKYLDESALFKILDRAYERALSSAPLPGIDSSLTLANKYLNRKGTLAEKVEALITWQNTKAATIGFFTGFGGITALPVTIPSNLASVLYIQIRMVAAIAIMGGYDLKNAKVKTMIFTCLCGNVATDVLKSYGIQLSTKLTQQVLLTLEEKILTKIQTTIAGKIIGRVSESGLLSTTKAVPFLGGIVSGTFDAFTTNAIGKVAKMVFINDKKNDA